MYRLRNAPYIAENKHKENTNGLFELISLELWINLYMATSLKSGNAMRLLYS